MPKSSPTIVVAGHACIDIIPALPGPVTFQPNTLTRIGAAAISTGGAVPNVGLALHRLGLRPRMVASVGDDDLGTLLVNQLRRFDPLYADALVVRPGGTTSYSVVVAPPGVDRAFWHCPGTNDTFSPREVPDAALEGASWLHVGYPPVMAAFAADPEGTAELFARVKRSNGSAKTSLDFCSPPAGGTTDWRRWLSIVLHHVDLFMPSFDEMAYVLGHDQAMNPDAVRSVVRELRELGASAVALKLGEYGVFFSDERIERYVPCLNVPVVTTTGAGDSTIAGLIAALAGGASVERALSLAVAAGAASCEAADATSGIPSAEILVDRVRGGWPRSRRLLFPNVMEVCL